MEIKKERTRQNTSPFIWHFRCIFYNRSFLLSSRTPIASPLIWSTQRLLTHLHFVSEIFLCSQHFSFKISIFKLTYLMVNNFLRKKIFRENICMVLKLPFLPPLNPLRYIPGKTKLVDSPALSAQTPFK